MANKAEPSTQILGFLQFMCFKVLVLEKAHLWCCGRQNKSITAVSKHTDLPMGSHTHTTSTHHCGKCCGTTWRGLGMQWTWPCSWDEAAVLCPGMHNLIHKQRRSNAASCCLHLHKHKIKMYEQIQLGLYYTLYLLMFLTICTLHIFFGFVYYYLKKS